MDSRAMPTPFAGSRAVYRRLLRAYPQAYRRDYGEAMEQLFGDQCRDAWTEAGRWGVALVWLRVVPDLVTTSLREHFSNFTTKKTMNDNLANLSATGGPSAFTRFFSIFVTVFLITVIVGTAITFLLPETYSSTCRVEFEPDVISNPSAASVHLNNPYDPYFIQTEFEVMQSQSVLGRVITNLNLNVEWSRKYFAGSPLKTSETFEMLRDRMVLQPLRNMMMVSITFYSEDRLEAAMLANAEAEAYKDYRETRQREMAERSVRSLLQEYQRDKGLLGSTNLDALEKASLETKVTQLAEKVADAHTALPYPAASPVQIIDYAEPGLHPVKPNKGLNITLSVVCGALLGAMVGLIAVWLPRMFRGNVPPRV